VFTLLRSGTYKYQSNWKCSALYPSDERSSDSVASATSGYSATHIQILPLNYDPFKPPLCRLRRHRGERGMAMSGFSLHYVPLQPHIRRQVKARELLPLRYSRTLAKKLIVKIKKTAKVALGISLSRPFSPTGSLDKNLHH
jgi:hypothetical protein